MADPPLPLLTGVKLALSPELLAISHIPQLANMFLLPSTIDAAVYNDLQRAIRVFGTFRTWTVGAMDGAAALGRLDMLKWLRANRMEGCSAQAFNNAAASNRLEVFYWLYEWYRGRCRVTEALVAGAAGGHLQVVKFLWRWRAYRDGEVVLEAAAANGHLEVVRYLLPQHSTHAVGQGALAAAAENNHVNVVRLLLERSRRAALTDHFRISAVEKAAAAGHLEIVSLLMECWEVGSGDVMRVNLALVKAMEKGDIQMTKLLLPKCDSRGAIKVLPDAIEGRYTELVRLLLPICNAKGMGLAVRAAATSNQLELVEHTLTKCRSDGIVLATEMVAVQEGFLAAVDEG